MTEFSIYLQFNVLKGKKVCASILMQLERVDGFAMMIVRLGIILL